MPEREPYSQGGFIYAPPAMVTNATDQPEPVIIIRPNDPPPEANAAPPVVRCGMCGGRCRRWGPRWIECRSGCCWSSHDPRRVGLLWRLRVLIGW